MKKRYAALLMAAAMTAGSAVTSFGGQWEQTGDQWKYQNDDGTYAAGGWMCIDSKYYYFGADGIMLSDTTAPDGREVDSTGAWTQMGKPWAARASSEMNEGNVLPTTIKAQAPTLADTGLSSFIHKTREEIVAELGEPEPCWQMNLFMFKSRPAAIFNISKTTNAGTLCFRIEGPFAAFFTCSGSDLITCDQIEQTLGVDVSIGKGLYDERWYARFVYNGCQYSIFSCTEDGVFRGDSRMSVIQKVEFEQEVGFFDTNGQWISL